MIDDNHYYVYIKLRSGKWAFERTCGTEEGAKFRLKELRARGREATYRVNELLPGALY